MSPKDFQVPAKSKLLHMYRILPTVLVIKNKQFPYHGSPLGDPPDLFPHSSLAPSMGWVLIYLLGELGGRSWAFQLSSFPFLVSPAYWQSLIWTVFSTGVLWLPHLHASNWVVSLSNPGHSYQPSWPAPKSTVYQS